jgi:hypothetical protein
MMIPVYYFNSNNKIPNNKILLFPFWVYPGLNVILVVQGFNPCLYTILVVQAFILAYM